MKPVYEVSSGCKYEGGGVDGIFIRKDLAEAKFNELVEEKRSDMRSMEEWEQKRELEGKRFKRVGYWLEEVEETHTTTRYTERTIVFKSEYISLREWFCEE